MKKILLFAAAAMLLGTSCVKDEIYEGPATIENVAFTPSAPKANQAITFTCKVSDLQGIEKVTFSYQVNGGAATTVDMAKGEGSELSATYSVTIPGQADNASIAYTISAKNKAGFTATTKSATLKIAPPILVYINECNPTTKQMELYNAMDVEVDLSGWSIRKDDKTDEANNWTIPAGTKIPAKGFIVFTQTTDFPFGMSATKGFKYNLYDELGGTRNVFDNLTTIKTLTATETIGRITDGSDNIVIFSAGTLFVPVSAQNKNSNGTVKP